MFVLLIKPFITAMCSKPHNNLGFNFIVTLYITVNDKNLNLTKFYNFEQTSLGTKQNWVADCILKIFNNSITSIKVLVLTI